MKTVTEIAASVLKKIGRLPDGQVAPESQVTIVREAYEEIYAELFNIPLVDWGEADDIPEYAAHHIKILLCGRVADDFGVDPTKYLNLIDFTHAKLAEQLANPSEAETTPSEYF